jgi:Na+/H+ antiporter NhaA
MIKIYINFFVILGYLLGHHVGYIKGTQLAEKFKVEQLEKEISCYKKCE